MSDYNYLAYNTISLGATAAKNYPRHNWNDRDTELLKRPGYEAALNAGDKLHPGDHG
jgi:hypothetical protein